MTGAGKNSAGLTIIELMIAMTVIAIALLQVVGVIMHTTTVKQNTRYRAIARQAASDKLTEMKTGNFDSVVLNFQGQNWDVEDLKNNRNPNNRGTGTVTIDDTNPDLLDVRIEIEYETTKGFVTYRTRSLITR